MLSRCMARTVSIVGAGRVGISLGKHLRELGWRIGAVVTRSKATARAAVRRIGAGKPFDRLTSEVCTADVILFATPDDVLPAIVRDLARIAGAGCKGKIALHTSATLDRSALAPLARLGASTGSLHPMQAFGGKVVPKLKGVIFGIEGDAKARRMAQSIAKSLGGIPVVIETADKPAYHAAAVMAGGSIYPVLEAGLELLMSIGFTRQRASQTLLPLLRQILDNIERIGPRAAWTGPLSRGDYAVVAKHMNALRRYPPEFAKSYAALAQLAARVLSKDPTATSKHLDRALRKGFEI
ncbi:MAG: Rossmann-like and DUF2520 domain-containing protein [Candidatus Acidiferrales bacterium]